MKITIKTLQQKQFQIEADGSDTIADLKAKIQETQGHAVEGQKIIYSGKVLPDSKTVESCHIKEKDFLVLMVAKPKPAPSTAATPKVESPAAPSTPTPQPPPAAATPPTAAHSASVAPAAEAPVSAVPSTPAAATQPPRAFGDTTSFLSGDQLQSSISNMVEMGFPRDQVMLAMRASYNNPDRAVEYLMTGIPPHLLAQTAPPTGAAAGGEAPPPPLQPTTPAAPTPASAPVAQVAPAPAPAAAPASNAPQNLFQLAQQAQQRGAAGGATNPLGGLRGPGLGAGAGGPNVNAAALEALRANPQMAQLRQAIQENPGLLQPLIQQLVANNPQMAQVLNQNPEALLNILGEGLDDEEFGAPGAGGPRTVNVTEEEMAAIQRLEQLGFTRQQAVEAYLACDKNEELAANYLFEGGFEDEQ